MQKSKRLLPISILTIVLLLMISCAHKKHPLSVRDRMLQLTRSCAYERILSDFESHLWSSENNPLIFMLYCDALVEQKKSIPSFLQVPSLPAFKAEFVKGYVELYQGGWQKSLESFIKITHDNDGKVWGYIGLLEYALYTESINNMEEPLRMLMTCANNKEDAVLGWAVPYYSARYYLFSGKYSEAQKLTQEVNEKTDPVTLKVLRGRLLIRNNQLDEALKIVEKMPDDIIEDNDVIFLEADIVGLKYGPKKQLEYLDNMHKKIPCDWVIEKGYADALMSVGETERGLRILGQLSQKRPFDVLVQLDLARNLLYSGRGQDVLGILKTLGNPIEFPDYNIFMAELLRSQKKQEHLEQVLHVAEKEYSNDPRLLWLRSIIYIENKEYEKAHHIIQQYLESDPYNISALTLLQELYYSTRKWSEVCDVKLKIDQSKRFIDEMSTDRINEYCSLALAAQGKFDEANLLLLQIHELSERNKTAAKIEVLKKDYKKRH